MANLFKSQNASNNQKKAFKTLKVNDSSEKDNSENETNALLLLYVKFLSRNRVNCCRVKFFFSIH